MSPFSRPTGEELEGARGRTIRDVAAPELRVLFCGINPSLYSAAVGAHFARPGNRFWPVLHEAGITDRVLRPEEQRELLRFGCGVTNLVGRATARADELSARELRTGGRRLARKLRRLRPRALCVLGVTAWRHAFGRPRATIGRQPERIGGVPVWVLPNPSGLNAHYQRPELARLFREMFEEVSRDAVEPAQTLK